MEDVTQSPQQFGFAQDCFFQTGRKDKKKKHIGSDNIVPLMG